jgi:DNA-binding GntR family transcriptional regulator
MDTLNRESATPVYQQIAEAIAERIDAGDLAPGDRIPSEQELVGRYGVARLTARRAVDMLVESRRACRVQGKGTFVPEGFAPAR